MPIFEEKLLCPLAVRFTQEHIRPVFQCDASLQAAIDAIKVRPGQCGYDAILEAPFPAIEVVRLRPRTGHDVEDEEDGATAHWFTLDNRRLYCLQRAAAGMWPQRCGVAMEVLYRPSENILKKHNSSTSGRAVGIGHSLKALVEIWDWRKVLPGAVDVGGLADATDAARSQQRLARECVTADDSQTEVEGLADAPAPPSMLDLHLQGGLPSPKFAGNLMFTSDASTTDPQTPRSSAGDDHDASTRRRPAAKNVDKWIPRGLAGTFTGQGGEKYEVSSVKQDASQWKVVKKDTDGTTKRFTLWYDKNYDCVWWGVNWSLYANAHELRKQPDTVRWLNGSDDGNGRPRFVWWRGAACEDAAEYAVPVSQNEQQQNPRRQRNENAKRAGKSRKDAKNVQPA